jgi:hypothetical protein
MSAMKAKFFISNVGVSTLDEHGKPKHGNVSLRAVCRGAVNKRWSSATPSGTFEMTLNGSAVQWFMERAGKEVAITLEDASSDPMTHAFVPLEQEIQAASYPDATCAECGHAEASHA